MDVESHLARQAALSGSGRLDLTGRDRKSPGPRSVSPRPGSARSDLGEAVRMAPHQRRAPVTPSRPRDLLRVHVSEQALNVRRHLAALRPFTREEFGTGVAAPSEGHIQAVNDLLASLRTPLERKVRRVDVSARLAARHPAPAALGQMLRAKSSAHELVRATEQVWDFYFELFGQRQGAYGEWLVACDRIALDCYQFVYLGLGRARSIPAPPPFSYMRTGFSPATYRRGIPLRKLGRRINPFPLIQLPYHRLVNPWTLGALMHEVSHNLQNELGIADAIPRQIATTLRRAGVGEQISQTWVRWNREIFGDMAGLLLGGEAFVGSLFDVIGRDRQTSLHYSPTGPHPTPYVRAFLSTELLQRLGFTRAAADYERLWRALYPNTRGTTIPPALLHSLDRSVPAVVDAVCFTSYPSLGDRCLAEVIRFQSKEQAMIDEAAERLARGVDPGVVPERFLIGAARVALERGLADPAAIAHNFYTELVRR